MATSYASCFRRRLAGNIWRLVFGFVAIAVVAHLLLRGFWARYPALAFAQGSFPTVKIKNGSYSGVYSPQYHQDFFLGLPYAQKPARFAVAQGLNSTWQGTRSATEYPDHCIGYGGDSVGYTLSEDCLYLNVIRPTGISAHAGLPVTIWIHGGGLFMGGSADKRYNLSFIVQRSVQMGTPILGVSLNYRLSGFGFLVGQEALDAGATNLGFRDQRLALQWVHENIASFGGSPEKVTIWGESSGAESVSAQILAYNGRNDGLFRAAMAESGVGGPLFRYPGGFNASDLKQQTYDNLVRNTSCASLVSTTASLDCLRNLPFDDINKAMNWTSFTMWAPVLDGDFISNYPANQLGQGNFPNIPILIGANSDEGTAFGRGRGPRGGVVNTDEDMREKIASILPSDVATTSGKTADALVDELMYLYPNIQAVGIPSLDIWPVAIQPDDSFARQLGYQYRRANALFGDLVMHYARRRANSAWSRYGVPSYQYRFNIVANGIADFVGATHFQEVAFVFLNTDGVGYASNPFGGSDTKYAQRAKDIAKTMSSAWINFIVGLDPNGAAGLGLEDGVKWPIYNSTDGGGVGKGIVFDLNGSYVEMDTQRAGGIDWFIKNSLIVLGM